MRKLDAIVRVSLDQAGHARNDVRMALTGALDEAQETGPFHWGGTSFFLCKRGEPGDIGLALANLGEVLSTHADSVDYVFVSMARMGDEPLVPPPVDGATA